MDNKALNAKRLAQLHFAVEPGMKQIFRLRAASSAEERPDEPIKLLEVNELTVPAGIMPLYFGPSPVSEIFYSTVILEVTPEEFAQIRNHELALPDGWSVGEELLPEPVVNGIP